MKKFSVVIAHRHATSISLEEEFFEALNNLAKEQNIPFNALITKIDEKRINENLSSALRVYVLKELQNKIKNF